MNPNYTDIFGRLDWLTKRIKGVFGAIGLIKQDITAIKDSGAGSYKVYTAIYTQAGVIPGDPPVLVNILENTIRPGITPSMTYLSAGLFSLDFGGAYFTVGKTFATCNMWADDNGTPLASAAYSIDDTYVRIGNTISFDVCYNISVEIRVYN